MDSNVLYFGDNLDVLRRHIPDASVDLIYLDPPFNSNQSYNVLFKETSGYGSDAQIEAFEDTWHWSHGAQAAYEEIQTSPHQDVARVLKAMLDGLGPNDVSAYLAMMTIRLVELQRVLSAKGSIYLHCDPTAGHYLKVIMDAVFGPENFRNEVVWKRTSGHSDAQRFGRVHDTILFYSNSAKATWNATYQPYDEEYIQQYYRYQDADGRRWMSGDASASGLSGGGYEYEWKGVTRVWRFPLATFERLDAEGRIFYTRNGIPRLKRYLDESHGLPAQDLWADIEAVRSWHEERLGYPTQKPLALLERIITASSNEGDLILDPFCGCGTAVHAAQTLGRRWIGIDITHIAIGLIRRRLEDAFPGLDVTVIGEPVDIGGARELADRDKYQFQWWVLDRVGAQPISGKKKGSDKGIDGVIPYIDSAPSNFKRVIVSVKGGEQPGVAAVRDLIGVMKREDEPLGLLVTLNPPTRDMKTEATTAGHYDNALWNNTYPRVQILTVEEILSGKAPDMPPQTSPFTKAPVERERAEKPRLL